MFRKYKYSILLIIFLLFFATGFCFALEVSLPGVPENATLPDYIKALFSIGVGLGGVISFLALIIAGVRYMTSAGNTETIREAKKSIKSAIFGLILLLSSYLILQRIGGTQLTNLQIAPITTTPDIYLLVGDNRVKRPCPAAVNDTRALDGRIIQYDCRQGGFNPVLWVFLYDESGYINFRAVREVQCGTTQGVADTGSFYYKFEEPGVYLFSQSDCAADSWRWGPLLPPGPSSTAAIRGGAPEVFKSAWIINDSENGIYYGLVAHSQENYRGKCILSALDNMTSGAKRCINLYYLPNTSSVTIYKYEIGRRPPDNGVTFYSDAFTKKGYTQISDAAIGNFYRTPADSIKFNYAGTGVSESEQKLCPNFQKCPGSIYIKGNYLVVLTAKDSKSTDNLPFCRALFKNDPILGNIKADEIVATEGRILSIVRIVPIKPD